MDNKAKLEELLHQREELLNRVEEQEAFLMELDAYKRTFVKTLVKEDLYVGFPQPNYKQAADFEVVKIEDEHPLFILNIGEMQSAKRDIIPQKYAVPINFRTLRYYKKSKINKKAGSHTWYTTTVLSKDGETYFVIKDSENNTWRGRDIFHQFCQSLDCTSSFNSIEEWLGLDKDEVQAMIRALDSCKVLLGTEEKEDALNRQSEPE